MKKLVLFTAFIIAIAGCRLLDSKTHLVVTFNDPVSSTKICKVISTSCYYDEYSIGGKIVLYCHIQRIRPRYSPHFFKFSEIKPVCWEDSSTIRDAYGDRVLFLEGKITGVFR